MLVEKGYAIILDSSMVRNHDSKAHQIQRKHDPPLLPNFRKQEYYKKRLQNSDSYK